jgi:hypothetical protein
LDSGQRGRRSWRPLYFNQTRDFACCEADITNSGSGMTLPHDRLRCEAFAAERLMRLTYFTSGSLLAMAAEDMKIAAEL